MKKHILTALTILLGIAAVAAAFLLGRPQPGTSG
jgi:hypothetical protein